MVAFLLGTRRDLREGKLRNSRVPGRENGVHLKQERLQLDIRWNYPTIQMTASWNELLKAILQPRDRNVERPAQTGEAQSEGPSFPDSKVPPS